MLELSNLSMRYGHKVLFEDVDLLLQAGNRYGIVGPNGCGKSTLLKVIKRREASESGQINKPNDWNIGWLDQDQFLHENDRVVDIVIRGKSELWNALQAKERLFESPSFGEKECLQLAKLEEIIAHHHGYTAESFACTLLAGLGIKPENHYGPLSALSGGFKIRVLLAQALFEEPEILLLDEPTNHLDIITIEWLKNFLKKEYKGLLMFVSHDRDFLNSVVTHILDIDYGTILPYVGDYEHFLIEKELVQEQKIKELTNRGKKIAQLQKFVDRFKAKKSLASQAQSKMKQIEKLKDDSPTSDTSIWMTPNFNFTQKRPSGKSVLTAEKLYKSYDEHKVLHNIGFQINRGEKVAIIGPNGVGKSTLLKILLDNIAQDSGSFMWGHETHKSYFAQDHHEQLKEDTNVFEWLYQQVEGEGHQKIRSVLGQVLFSGKDAEKNVLTLSGGEAARLLFANIILQHGNVLILDEPTNHLDLEAIDALTQALKRYEGTVIFVSHNRYFISELATRVLALTPQGIKDFHGNYQEYLVHYEDYLKAS